MASNRPVGEVMVDYLQSIPDYLRPNQRVSETETVFDVLAASAANVNSAAQASVIVSLLGPGGSFGSDVPTTPLVFPADHQLHLKMGLEWYWLSCNLEVVDPGAPGNPGSIGVLIVMTRQRAVSNAVQATAGWSDTDAQVVDTAATVTLATPHWTGIVRRRPNVQWTQTGGSVEFGQAGGPFLYRNGNDVLMGPAGVLPLEVMIDDSPNMRIELTVTAPSGLTADNAYFLETPGGISGEPGPGLYYSWPQLAVTGRISVTADNQDLQYEVKGTGWIDHQLMMADTEKPKDQGPVLMMPLKFLPLDGFSGWSWCQFNLSNGDAVAVAGFQMGTLRTTLQIPSGKYIMRNIQPPGGPPSTGPAWTIIPLVGSVVLDQFVPGLENTLIPSSWVYRLVDAQTGGNGMDLLISPVPLYPDGTFLAGTLNVVGETAVNVALTNRAQLNLQFGPGQELSGTGFCEAIGYESIGNYTERALAFLVGL